MDKFEYKVRAEEIRMLIARGDYGQAAEIADTIDWRRVKSVMMLCTISDLYKINRRYEDARDMLLLAYDRHPGGRTIVYSLCELSIKMEEFLQAVEYYKEFVQVAPKDTSRYILQYKLYEAQDVSLEERIAVLEELKKRDYREKWAYELAYLYHRVGLSTRCVEECDELILWFGDGKYVIKAMELKMLHEPLTPQQQQKYDYRFQPRYDQYVQEQPEQKDNEAALAAAAAAGKAVVAKSRKDTAVSQPDKTMADSRENKAATTGDSNEDMDQKGHVGIWAVENDSTEEAESASAEHADAEMPGESLAADVDKLQDEDAQSVGKVQTPATDQNKAAAEPEELDIQVKTVDVSQFNTINLQKELAEGLKEVLGEDDPMLPGAGMSEPASGSIMNPLYQGDTESLDSIQIEEVDEDALEPEYQESEVFFGEENDSTKDAEMASEECIKVTNEQEATPKELADKLSMEADGQIKMVLPQSVQVEKQITGQLNIDDVLVEWEKIKSQEAKEVALETDCEENDGVEELTEIEEMDEEEENAETPEDETVAAEETQAVSDELIGGAEEVTQPKPEAEAQSEPEAEAQSEPEAEAQSEPEAEAQSEPEAELQSEPAHKQSVRSLTNEEKELFGSFIQTRSTREMLVRALDQITLAGHTGNVIVTGDPGMNTMDLAKNIVREIQMTDSNFSGKTAKISGAALNKKDVTNILERMQNGALIVEKASGMNAATADAMYKKLQQDSVGIVVVLEDTRKEMTRFLESNKKLAECFNARMDMEALNNETLVSFGKKYARELEYSIDEQAAYTLHSRIAQMQGTDHAVTIMDVKEIVDEAIRRANRKTIAHFFDVLLAKRYDEDDMIILREKDFA